MLHKELQDIRGDAKMTARVLHDIWVLLKWGGDGIEDKRPQVETPDTVIRASSVYKRDQIENLLRASETPLSLALSSDVTTDTVSAIFMPQAGSNVPISDSVTYNCSSGEKRDDSSNSLVRAAIILETIAENVVLARKSRGYLRLKSIGNLGERWLGSGVLGSLGPIMEVYLTPVSTLVVMTIC